MEKVTDIYFPDIHSEWKMHGDSSNTNNKI